MTNLPITLDTVSRKKKDTEHTLAFTVSNTSDKSIYEFVKLFVGDTYIGLTFLDLDPGEQRTTTFTVDEAAASSNPTVILTMNDRSQDILLEQQFMDIDQDNNAESSPEPEEPTQQPEQEPEPKQTGDQPTETTSNTSGIIGQTVDHLLGKSSSEETEGEQEETEEEEEEITQTEGEHDKLPSEKVNRLKTGVINLDSKMQGGIVEGTMNLVTGKTGTGKTAFCASFLKKGAEEGQSGVYVTTEEREEDIKADIESMFGWNFDHLEEEGVVKILSIKPIFPSKEIDNLNRLIRSYISNLLDQVMHAVDSIDADRVIIDSVSIIEMFIRDEYMSRVALASLLNKLREANVTALLTGTVPETSEGLSGGGIIEFLVDTVILLEFVPIAEEHKRTLTIRKMRRTDHDVAIFPFDITPDGIHIYEVI